MKNLFALVSVAGRNSARVFLGLMLAALWCTAVAKPLDARMIGEAAGTKANVASDGTVRIGWSRNDVVVQVDGMVLPPAAGLGSWAAFTPAGTGAMVMGDTVVFQDEVDAAMDAAFSHGLDVTALHNHFFYDQPRVFFMHIGGEGDPRSLAIGVKAVWDAIRAVRATNAKPATAFPGGTPRPGRFNTKILAAILGNTPVNNHGVLKIAVARSGHMHGIAVGGPMGLTTWAAFTGSDALAVMDGDFIMSANEVQPVLRALRKAGIHIVALHNHMLGGEPQFFFLHFWGKGAAVTLAHGLRSALDAQKQISTTAKET